MDNVSQTKRHALRVLIADDNAPFRRRLHNLLDKNPDVECVGEAADGEDAVRLAHALQPNVVVMDILMPRLNGIEATRQIANQRASIKIIALSGNADAGFRQAMLDAGAFTYLLKDNVRHELPDVLRSIAAAGYADTN